jgi:hypothetical protein
MPVMYSLAIMKKKGKKKKKKVNIFSYKAFGGRLLK